MKKFVFILLNILIISAKSFGQFSKTHYIPPLSSSTVFAGEQYLYISTPKTTPVNIKIIEIGGSTILGTVTRDNPYIYNVGYGNDTQLHVDSSLVNGILNNKGYIVEAEDQVYVSARVIDQSGNQAGELVSKGLAALGTHFRSGALLNTNVQSYQDFHYTFISVLATENNTTVNFSGFPAAATFVNGGTGTVPSVVLNSGESYVIAVQGPNNANRDALVGSLITSDKPIALNCGSYGGSNAAGNLDLGFDQIVPKEKTGQEYIFIKSTGIDDVERAIIVADEDNTEIFLNGSTTPTFTIDAGQYASLTGNYFSQDGNLYVNTSKKVFAYQCVGDNSSIDQRNQEMFFVPPLSCQTPRVINNIPQIEFIGTREFTGRVTLVTKTGSTLTFTIDGVDYDINTLPASINVVGPTNVNGNPNYVSYVFTGMKGNVSVFSTNEVYLAAYGTSFAATFGGYYSGFTSKPEISLSQIDVNLDNCLPNTTLSVNSLSPFDTFQWYYNDMAIPFATNNFYNPIFPGNYYVSATISACGSDYISDNIPVSICPEDNDNDGCVDDVDLDLDNDGITNCAESFGDLTINSSNILAGNIVVDSYNNSFIGTVTTTGIASTNPVIGNANGNIVLETPQGKNNSATYSQSYNQPVSIAINYTDNADISALLSSNTEIRIKCPSSQTITILNPSNQLLVDTNFDGIFENNVTRFSNFEIRFRLNGNLPLQAGTGDFAIKGKLLSSISVTAINLVDDDISKTSLKIIATCVPKDSDNDGIPDQLDYDSDNDSIPDFYESQGSSFNPLTNVDTNNDGIDDVFGTAFTPADNDSDGVQNYLDLDSDNDGIFDIIEAGSPSNQTNTNGVVITGNFGSNGLANNLETSPNSGIINFTVTDTDNDGIFNYLELDSDDDDCFDVTEASFSDSNNDGILGNDIPINILSNGTVLNASGYSVPNGNYIIPAPISITTQPVNITTCELQSTQFTVTSPEADSFQWQLSTDAGVNWINLTNTGIYSGVNTSTLTISNVTAAMAGYTYRVFLNRTGNSCGLYSNAATLTTYALPSLVTPISLKQCDDDTDGISVFNLTQKNDFISANYQNETFTYYTTLLAANTQDTSLEITNPIAFSSGNNSVFVRVENSNGCFSIGRINLVVSVTQIPSTFVIPNQYKCDDYLDASNDDRDGVSSFNFTPIYNSLSAILPSNVSIKFYKTEADFLAETDILGNSLAIQDITNYRNIGFPNQQTIWVRVDSTLDNSCFGFKTFDVVVEALPFANPVNTQNLIRHCDDNQDGIFGFDTSGIQATVLNGQTGVNVKYFNSSGVQLSSPLPNPFYVNGTETITIRVSNNTTQTGGQSCYDEETLQFIVDDLPEVFPIDISYTTICDDELDPLYQDGEYNFPTTGFQEMLLGNQTDVNIYYYDENNKLLSSPLPNPFKTSTQNIRVVVENPINTSCTAELIIPFVVKPTPKIDLYDSTLICLPDTTTTIDAAIIDGSSPANYSYQWYKNGDILIGENQYQLVVSDAGEYSVTVKNSSECIMTRIVEVIASEIATIQNIEIHDLSSLNTVLINVTGSGVYEYSLDDMYGPYRDSNFFQNVPIGEHDVYVRDKNGCGIVGPMKIYVLGIPNFFTPNGDGYNDYWNIQGVNPVNANSIIYIFDRYGKLLKQISATGNGWDGTYNNNLMPSDDYWYNIQLSDGRNVKGHFTLKR